MNSENTLTEIDDQRGADIAKPGKSKAKPKTRPKWSRSKKVLIWAILLVLTTTIGWILKRVYDRYWDGDSSAKYIAVVMSTSDLTFTIPREFKQGFGDAPSLIPNDKKQTIFISQKEDLYSVEQAKKVADDLVADDKYVLIIGNSNSQLSEITLNSILSSKDRPAFILPIATADNIITKANAEEYKSILRMVPDNSNQAATITRFIFGEVTKKLGRPARVAILVDEENQTYSVNLAKNVAAKVIADNSSIILNKFYGNSNRLVNDFPALKSNAIVPDVIVYVGVTSNGMLLIEEMKSLGIKTPVIFTDGCTVKELIEKAKLLGSPTYFLSAVSKSNQGLEPTYEPIGKDAFKLADLIMNSIEGPITRESVRNFIALNKDKIRLEGGMAGKYQFNDEGNNSAMNFKMYTYVNGILTSVQGLD